jgi:carbonic anhydrase/acetyltransferase-like protein (isoleucine patch superfamily)
MDIEKKYELTPSDKEGLFRIKAVKDFNDVKKGDIGGYVESENNLSHDGNCWIYDNAQIWGNVVICDNAVIQDNAQIWGNAHVYGNAIIDDEARIYGNAVVRDSAVVRGNARIYDNAEVRSNAKVWGDADICGNADICGDAIISSDRDYIVFKNWWSSGRYFTWTRSNNMWSVGCFYGTGEELIAKAYADSEEKGREYEKIVKYVEGVNHPYTQTLEKTWKYRIYIKLLSLKTLIVKLLR